MEKIVIRIISMVLLIITFGVIFGFSSQSGVESGGISRKVTVKFVNIFPYTKNLKNETKMKLIEHGEPIVRKMAHLSIYTVVGMCIMSFMATFPVRLRTKLAVSILVGIIYAVSDEWHQSFVPGRGPDIKDVLIDTTGVCLGIIIVLVFISVYLALRDK